MGLLIFVGRGDELVITNARIDGNTAVTDEGEISW